MTKKEISKVTLDKNNKTLKIMWAVEDNEESLHIEEIQLVKVTEKELLSYRASKKAGFVLKVDCELYLAQIPKNVKLIAQNVLGSHMCGKSGAECNRFSPALESEGGCSKVRDASFDYYVKDGYSKKQALIMSKRIEKYDFISLGYETFNTLQDVFVVVGCNHYAKCGPRRKLTPEQKKKAMYELGLHIFPDADSLAEMKARAHANACYR